MERFTIVIHGGAGSYMENDFSQEQQFEYKAKLKEALNAGYSILENGGSSLDAVQAAVVVLEDSPLFNAGKGAVLTNEGKVELDSSIMDGVTLNAGSVASVTTIKNPINAARKVMENSPHVFLVGKGAETFAEQQGLEIVANSYFITDERKEQLNRIKENEELLKKEKLGTVGAVALDKNGNMAAATSTGGMVNKRFGRVGDSPIIGAGTYANTICAISCTGHGEYFIRFTAAKEIAALMEYKGISLKEATSVVIHKKIALAGGAGGVIGVDANGNIVLDQNTSSMFRGFKNANETSVEIFN